MDTEWFVYYLKTQLCPRLKAGDAVILDNLRVHHAQEVKKLIEARAAQVKYLPAYSPDLNPIEPAFSQLKAHIRKEGPRTAEELVESVSNGLAGFASTHCKNYFRHANYATN